MDAAYAAHVGEGGGGGHALGGGAVYEYMNGRSHVVGGYTDTYNAAFGVAADARGASGGGVTGGAGGFQKFARRYGMELLGREGDEGQGFERELGIETELAQHQRESVTSKAYIRSQMQFLMARPLLRLYYASMKALLRLYLRPTYAKAKIRSQMQFLMARPLLRLYYASITPLLRPYYASIKALFRLC